MSQPKCGRIELIIGPMFAGKSSELMKRVNREVHRDRKAFVIKYAWDNRYSTDSVASHDDLLLKADVSVARLMTVGDGWRDHDVIAIDEGQFYPDLVEFCNMVANEGKLVVIAALDADYLLRPFGKIAELTPFCERIDKLSAVCMHCKHHDAHFTHRLVDSTETELIGGADMYIPTCRACYRHLNANRILERAKAENHTIEDSQKETPTTMKRSRDEKEMEEEEKTDGKNKTKRRSGAANDSRDSTEDGTSRTSIHEKSTVALLGVV